MSWGLLLAAVTTLVINHRQLILPVAAGGGSGPFSQFILCQASDPLRPGHLLIGTASGLFSSEDGGASYRAVALPRDASQGVTDLFFRGAEVWAALRQEGIFHSSDSGASWTRLPFEEKPIQSLGADLTVCTPAGLHRAEGDHWLPPVLPATRAESPDTRGRWFVRLAYNLHDGQFWGRAAVVVTDTVAISLIGLTLSGFALSWWPRRRGSPPAAPGRNANSFR